MKAFPASSMKYEDLNGMDLRDYFAAKALPMAYKHYKFFLKEEADDYFTISGGADSEVHCEMIAKWSYSLADAMMKARESKDD